MSLVVACSLPSSFTFDHGGRTIVLNGANVSTNMDVLPANGASNDTELRAAGYGLTFLTDGEAELFLAWADSVTKGVDGKYLVEPFAPIATGAIKWNKTEKEARTEAKNSPGTGIPGIDPEKELPKEGLEPATKD